MEEKQSTQKASLSDSQAIQPETPNASPNSGKSKSWLIIMGIILLILIAIVGYFLVFQNKKQQITEEDKVYHVGVLSGLSFFATVTDGFKAKMMELGYADGKNITYDVQETTNIEMDKYKQILSKFVADKVDLILAFPTEAALDAKTATKGTNIPVIFANAAIEGINLVDSISHPGGNITGVRLPGPEQSAKRLEILHEIVPQAKRVWVTYLKNYPIVPKMLEVVRSTASSLGIMLIEVPVNDLAGVQADLQARAKASEIGIDAMLLVVEPMGVSSDGFAVISQFAAEHKIPVGGAMVFEGDKGSVFSFIGDDVEVGGLSALLADKILKNIPAGTIPVVSPESRLKINYRVAQKLGLTIPEALLSQADKIIH
jgi:putative tryptophan/tyrosine transport system substrate-binding protein